MSGAQTPPPAGRSTPPAGELPPLEVLFDVAGGVLMPLPPELALLYGPLRLPRRAGDAWIVGNVVSTLDGVVALGEGPVRGGAEISGASPHDRVIVGLLRAVADAVIVGAGTTRSIPRHRWLPEVTYPPLAGAFGALRRALGKAGPPLTTLVTASGEVEPRWALFRSPDQPVLVVTTTRGARRLAERDLPPWARVVAASAEMTVSARAILGAVREAGPAETVLVEGGPRLLASFLAESTLDELFLTLAPQLAGRDVAHPRPGLVDGHVFAPDDPRWATLVAVRRQNSHLFLRYAFRSAKPATLGVAGGDEG